MVLGRAKRVSRWRGRTRATADDESECRRLKKRKTDVPKYDTVKGREKKTIAERRCRKDGALGGGVAPTWLFLSWARLCAAQRG